MKNELKTQKAAKVGVALLDHYLATRGTITYSELCELLDFKVCSIRIGYFLGLLAEICNEKGLPDITALVVSKKTGICAEAFFREANLNCSYEEYLQLIKNCTELETFRIELINLIKISDN